MSLSSLFGCFGKKSAAPKKIDEWLEIQWAGRFEVISTPTNFTDKDYYFDKRESVIAEKADMEVQFVLPWIKNQKDLGLTKDMVEEALSRSRTNLLHARALLEVLKTKGLEKISVDMGKGYADIFIFAEPAPDMRDRFVRTIIDVKDADGAEDSLSYVLYFMEEQMFGTQFKEIIPAGHWARRDSWQHSNEIMSLAIPGEGIVNFDDLKNQWRFNTLSERTLVYIANAHAEALKWSDKNVRGNITIEDTQMVEFGLDESDGLLIKIDFPYFEPANDAGDSTASGMISGRYHVDKRTFENIHLLKFDEEVQ